MYLEFKSYKAGELYQNIGSHEKALNAYKEGKAFRPAVELCRIVYPAEVVKLEEVIKFIT